MPIVITKPELHPAHYSCEISRAPTSRTDNYASSDEVQRKKGQKRGGG